MTKDPHQPTEFDARLDLVPTSPGVYLMKNAAGSVIYVGKAIDLRNRLRSYFGPNPQGNEKVQAMISHIADFSYLIVQNELEALVLESNLIKRYKPFYNILLKDDHDYPYLRITMNELYPRAVKAYRVGPDVHEGARYYGPYLAGDLYRALKTLHDIFPMKTCRRVFPRDIGKEKPCLNYYIHRCIAPCKGDVPAEDYRRVMQSVCDFLDGRHNDIVSGLKAEMTAAAEALDFEQAAVLRDRIASLTKLMESQIAVANYSFDCDAIGVHLLPAETCVLKLEVRGGKISGTSTFFLSADGDSLEDVVKAFVEQHYPSAAFIPGEILLPFPIATEVQNELAGWLSQMKGTKVQLRHPQRGDKRKIVEMAVRNAEEAARRRNIIRGDSRTSIDEGLHILQTLCGLDQRPTRIEAYDISNIASNDQACGMVVFTDGRPARSRYRRFKIRGNEGQQDDYAAICESVRRRLTRLDDADFGEAPDLILLDGGNNHVSVVRDMIRSEGLPAIPVAGVVKDGRHRTRGLALGDGVIAEFALSLGTARGDFAKDSTPPEGFDQIDRESRLAALRLLTAIQDEAHRFAGSYTRTLNKKRQLKYKLESIPGIGPARREALMKAFRGIKAVSEATVEELLDKVPALGEKQARAVFDHFHPEE